MTAGAPVAAIDCGTNSTRLLVADSEGRRMLRLARITRLGQGVDATGRLGEEALGRTLGVLRDYRAEMDRLGVATVRVSATSAARDAVNRGDFFGPAREIVGTRLELLSGEEEGRLSFAGATAELDPQLGPYVVTDIGGGSTEVVLGPTPRATPPAPPQRVGPVMPRRPVGAVSVDVGCVRLTERFLLHDPPLRSELEAAAAAARDALDRVVARLPGVVGAPVLVGLAGTITTLAAIALGGAGSDVTHHSVLTRDQVDRLLGELAGRDQAGRLALAGLEPARADVIVGGALLLATLLDHLGFDGCLVSESDILDGMVASLLPGDPAGI